MLTLTSTLTEYQTFFFFLESEHQQHHRHPYQQHKYFQLKQILRMTSTWRSGLPVSMFFWRVGIFFCSIFLPGLLGQTNFRWRKGIEGVLLLHLRPQRRWLHKQASKFTNKNKTSSKCKWFWPSGRRKCVKFSEWTLFWSLGKREKGQFAVCKHFLPPGRRCWPWWRGVSLCKWRRMASRNEMIASKTWWSSLWCCW